MVMSQWRSDVPKPVKAQKWDARALDLASREGR